MYRPPAITNPAIPCSAVVPFNNIRDHKVVITGIPLNQHPRRFSINFRAPNGDIYFHINPRFDETTIVRNAQFSGSWGGEERQLSVPFPFQYGIPYQVTIHVDRHSFRVELNGMVICAFPHRRRPLNQIRNVEITGATTISRVEFF